MTRRRKDYAAIAVQQRTGRDVPELIRELYVDRRHTQQEIAKALEVGRDVVSRWLVEYGISRDDRPPVEVVPVTA